MYLPVFAQLTLRMAVAAMAASILDMKGTPSLQY